MFVKFTTLNDDLLVIDTSQVVWVAQNRKNSHVDIRADGEDHTLSEDYTLSGVLAQVLGSPEDEVKTQYDLEGTKSSTQSDS